MSDGPRPPREGEVGRSDTTDRRPGGVLATALAGLRHPTSNRVRMRLPGKSTNSPPRSLEHRMLLTATFCLLAYGAVMVYSASSASALLEGQGDGTALLIKYVGYGVCGLLAMRFLSRVPLDRVRRLTPLVLGGAYLLVLLVLVPGIGLNINGARRWLGFGPIQFQPSEVMKIALVLHVSSVVALRPWLARDIRGMLGPVVGVAGLAVLLIAAQPDLGTALVTSFTVAALMVAAGLPVRQLATTAGVGAAAVGLFALLEPYRRARLTAFLDPWADPGGAGFQSVQGLIALGSGGMFGVGLGQSVQKINYLPEAHTDFILAVIGEELGVAGIAVLLLLYGLIAYAGLRVAKNATGLYAKLLATGVTSLILSQALLNVYTVLGLAPLTGVPLPFISSGSTSLIVLLCGMGLLLNVASGGSAHLRALPEPRVRPRKATDDRDRRTQDRDRDGRDGGTRRPGDRGRRRAAG